MTLPQVNMLRAAVVGVGAVGSFLAEFLARSGLVRSLVLVDPDVVELHNIPGQAFGLGDVDVAKVHAAAARVRSIAPAVEVVPYASRLEALPWGAVDADVVFSPVDTLATRRHVNAVACALGVPLLIDAGVDGAARQARVAVVQAARGACLTCHWGAGHLASLEERVTCDGEPAPGAPTNSPAFVSALAAALAVTQLHLVRDLGAEAAGHLLFLDAAAATLYRSRLPRNPQCAQDHAPWSIQALARRPEHITIGEALSWAPATRERRWERGLGIAGARFSLRRTCATCDFTESRWRVHRAGSARSDRHCPACGMALVSVGFDVADRLVGSALDAAEASRSLADLGILPGDVLVTSGDGGEAKFLAGRAPGARSRLHAVTVASA